MAGTAAEKPGSHVNVTPAQWLGSNNRAAPFHTVLSAPLDSYSEKEATSCATIWAAIAVILEFHQEGEGHNDMALDQSNLPRIWPVVWRLHTLLGLGSPLSVQRFWTIIKRNVIQTSSPRYLTGYATWWSLQREWILQYSAQSSCVVQHFKFQCTELSMLQSHLNGHMTDGRHSLTLHFHLVCNTAIFNFIITYFSK